MKNSTRKLLIFFSYKVTEEAKIISKIALIRAGPPLAQIQIFKVGKLAQLGRELR